MADTSKNFKGKFRKNLYDANDYEKNYYGNAAYQYKNNNNNNDGGVNNLQKNYYENTVEAYFIKVRCNTHQCKMCKAKFFFNNLLHIHVRFKCITLLNISIKKPMLPKKKIPLARTIKSVESKLTFSTYSIIRFIAVKLPFS